MAAGEWGEEDPLAWRDRLGRQSVWWEDVPDIYEGIPGLMDAANDPNANPWDTINAYLDEQRAGQPPGTVDQGDAELLAGINAPSGTGAAATQRQLEDILASIRTANAGQEVDLSGLDVGDFPTFEVPGENLSPSIDDTLLSQMEGFDPLGTEDFLAALLERTAGGGFNSQRLRSRLEAARENLTGAQKGALADLRGVLADRGLISLPGSSEGAELDATTRWMQPLQREYLSQARGIEADESIRADEAELDALTRATGWTSDEAKRRLAAADSAGGRQQMLSSVALDLLGKNMQWNQFLAEFGLDREALENEIRRGNIDAVAPILAMILQYINAARGGYI